MDLNSPAAKLQSRFQGNQTRKQSGIADLTYSQSSSTGNILVVESGINKRYENPTVYTVHTYIKTVSP